MSRMIVIKCENDNKKYEFELGTTLKEVAGTILKKPKYLIVGARVNNKIKELWYDIYKPKHIKFIDISDIDGMRMYIRSLCFVFIKAVSEKYPSSMAVVKHSISQGLYCEIDGLEKPLTDEDVKDIKNRMKTIIDADIPFVRKEIETTEAIRIFNENKLFEKAKLFKTRSLLYTSVYYLDKTVSYFYGALVPSTGYLQVFDLIKYNEGMLLRFPITQNPDHLGAMIKQDQLFKIFKEHKRGIKILGIEGVGSLNEIVQYGNIGEIIKISEALHEKKIANIADEIYNRKDKLKVILISGPSSSGKTSFCKRLAIQLKVIGLKPVLLYLDDYFLDRELTPKDENDEYDFENLNAIDVKLLNENLLDLMAGKEVHLPKFDFAKGRRINKHTNLKIKEDNIILMEGIHGLNPELTPMIPHEAKYKIYVSALTQIAIDNHTRIPTTDNRVLRRIVRDYKYRGCGALEILKRWSSVRRGEEINIFPYQEEADAMFNSALMYEFGVLKKYAEPILRNVPQNAYEFSEVTRLLKFVSYFLPIDEIEIPPTSILREFLGGSSFEY